MMEPLSFEKGRIVISIQGRDKGHPFLVLESIGKDMVAIADGLVHPQPVSAQGFLHPAL